MTATMRAYCPECKRMVTDDMYKTEDGSVNKHEHDVLVLVERGTVPSGGAITPTMEMTPESYLLHASRLDAELIIGRIKAKYNIPFAEKFITDIVGKVLQAIREVAIEAEHKDRKKAQLRKKLEEGKKQEKKPKKAPEPPLT